MFIRSVVAAFFAYGMDLDDGLGLLSILVYFYDVLEAVHDLMTLTRYPRSEAAI